MVQFFLYIRLGVGKVSYVKSIKGLHSRKTYVGILKYDVFFIGAAVVGQLRCW